MSIVPIENATGEPSAITANWQESRSTLHRMSLDADANKESLALASVILDSLCAGGGAHAPIPSLDADGDVVLTWHRGRLKASAIVADQMVSSIVSNGRKVAYIGAGKVVNALTIEGSDLLGFGGPWKCKIANRTGLDASTTSNKSDARSSYLSWGSSSGPSKVLLVIPDSSSSNPEMGDEWNQSSGQGSSTRMRP